MRYSFFKKQWQLTRLMFLLFFSLAGSCQLHAQSRGARPRAAAPATRPAPATRQTPAAKPAPATRPTSSTKPAPAPVSKPSVPSSQPSVDKSRKDNISNSGNTTNNIGSNNNKVNIDNSKKNVNINVDNSKDIRVNNSMNTTVRVNSYHPYTRPPYRYGGHSYYCYHPYYYHPYRPFYWGPVWHPWGFFIATLATTAILVNVSNQQYYYDQGVYYMAGNGGYTVVSAPLGATVVTLPPQTQTVVVNETTNNYYYGGTYYEKAGEGYTVVAPLAGTLVESLPDGGDEIKLGDITYVKIGETYYQPIEKDGKNMYEVVQMEKDK